ncbi:MarR family winged helix-turn-helix transcriptional regulator [Nocardia sp. NPDC059246]|uniref:MarR family winged helix-turn-helix transcriptional regulator n=1 Tax=unclassified Nocardia TaxID=2637762 RepID=UPI0036B492EC
MPKPTELLEFQTMLMGRFSLIARKAADTSLDRSAYLLLSLLEADGPMSIGRLSEILGLDVSTLNRQTAALLRAGLAERIPDPDGGVARKFRLTPEGASRLNGERAQSIRHLDEIVADWTAEEVTALADSLARLNADIDRYRNRISARP